MTAHDDGERLSSTSQDVWVEIAEAVRDGLAKRLKQMPSMQTGELYEFVETLNNARWLEIQCRIYDEPLEAERREAQRTQFDD